MRKAIHFIVLLALAIVVVSGFSVLPTSASKPRVPHTFNIVSSNESQITFMLAITTYLPVIYSSPEPPPQPPPLPPGVWILQNYSHYVTSGGYLHIVGDVYNNKSNTIEFLQMVVDVYDSNGILLDTDFTYTDLHDIPAGTVTCYNLSLEEPPGWSYYELSGTYYDGGGPLPNLTVFNTSSTLEPDGDYEIIGQVRNDHGTRVEYVQPVLTLYDNGGIVVDCDFTYVNGTHLDPGQTSSFKETFYDRNYSDVVSYRVQVDGNPQ